MKRIISMILSTVMLVSSLLLLSSCSVINGVDGVDGFDGTDGKDALIPVIGENGNWWIGGVDTGVSSVGEKGDKGDKGQDGDDSIFDGENGKDYVAPDPKFRVNVLTNKIEVSYDGGESWASCGAASNSSVSNNTVSYPVNTLPALAGYLNHEGKYVVSTSDGDRHGVIIDVSAFIEAGYTKVTLERNVSVTPIEYAFIESELVLNTAPTYSQGFARTKFCVNPSVELEIPEGAKYLYLMHNQKISVCLPNSVTFSK